jgi:SpoVK/Ycf46/Vps4 family AAA+-type ATPase
LQACRTISLRGGTEFAKLVVPRRRRDDLVLHADLHRRVLEVAAFYRAWSRVDEGWGFGRLLTGGGIKVLMTGDSGTGKTAAAEVIAGEIDAEQVLLKVHLASVVSKWVGETEKNLEAVFQKAEESHAILFFDEADVLFAKRGEVERGSDRYSNLEVGFLLQRLEDFAGLAILASNHKDQIDEAFMRRFQVVLHFPRPGLAERRRLWQLALPAQAPKADDIDIEVLQQLDLTGAGIVNAARTAALLAAQEDDARIGMKHLISAVDRQFQHEARVLPTAQLGRFARLAESAA